LLGARAVTSERPLRICFVTFSGFPDQGATYAYEMSRSAAGLGHDVTAVAIARAEDPGESTVDGVRAIRLAAPITVHWASPSRWLYKFKFMLDAARIVRRGDFDVVHVYCTIGAALVPWFGGRRPVYAQEHVTGAVSWASARLRAAEDWLRAAQGRFFDANFTVSEELGRRLFKGGAFDVMPAGVNLRVFGGNPPQDFRAAHGIAGDEIVFVHAGVLEAARATDVPVRAFAEAVKTHPRLRLLVPGKGSQLDDLRALARELGVEDRVWLPGYVPYTELPRVFAAADAGLSYLPPTAYYGEGQPPMKVMEYMGAGLPVLASDVGSHRVLVRNEENGLLSRPGVQEYAALLTRFAGDAALRARLAAGARPTVESMTYDRIAADRLVPIYRRLIARRAA
jgi:glycosyltransferase involved in cell wall biosynthesis